LAGDALDKRLARTSGRVAPPASTGRVVKVETEADLGKLRRVIARHEHDDERLRARVVTIHRNGATVGSIICATDALAFDALRLVVGRRFKRENAAA
jgi:hypothetical protein